MGKFRLSELFHKLRQMVNSTSPVKSATHRLRRRSTAAEVRSSSKPVSCPVSSGCSFRAKLCSGKSHSPGLADLSTSSGDSSTTRCTFSPELRSDHVLLPHDNSGSWRTPCSSTSEPAASKSPEFDLRPIITKPSTAAKKSSTERRRVAGRKMTSPRSRMRVRLSSPRVSVSGGRRRWRRNTAVVKETVDPRRDFKESMVEMIVENKIRASKDMEELLICYLSLNSEEYHHIIITVFKQIWLDLIIGFNP